jgi:hypothetical protein
MSRSSHRTWNSRHFNCAAGAALLAAVVAAWASPANTQTMPTDAQPTCTVTPAQFKTWFQSGTVALNGVVNPADSVTFNEFNAQQQHINCPFYQWSKQMFLWLTSPTPPVGYGNTGGRILDSAAFFDVSPPEANGNRTFIPHVFSVIRFLPVRAAQLGPHGLPVIFDTAGRMLEVQHSTATPVVRTTAGTTVEVESARLDANRKLILLDKTGGQIELLPPAILKPGGPAPTGPSGIPVVQEFNVGGVVIVVDSANNVIDVEQGQAEDGGVLEAQNGSLVYFATIVNDVYAYFRTGIKDGKIAASSNFPTTQGELNTIVNFAATAAPPNNRTFPDPTALTIEIKSAWVETTGLANLGSYITMTATVPTYNTSNANKWTANGQKTVELALVGMHVVGSVKGHPEMIWATFEHSGNTPNAGPYQYFSCPPPCAGGGPITTKTVQQSTTGSWLFAKTNPAAPFNVVHMCLGGSSCNPAVNPATDIISASGFTISPSNTIRWKPFGAASDVPPNPLAVDPVTQQPSIAASNTDIISINHSIASLMPSGDVRNNYYMTGATWTELGEAPTSHFPSGNEVGTSVLAGTTMETYQQGIDTTSAHGGSNCFDCHSTFQNSFTAASPSTGVSHVFGALSKLF